MNLALLELNIFAVLEEAGTDFRTLRVEHNGTHALALLQRLPDVRDGLLCKHAPPARRDGGNKKRRSAGGAKTELTNEGG